MSESKYDWMFISSKGETYIAKGTLDEAVMTFYNQAYGTVLIDVVSVVRLDD